MQNINKNPIINISTLEVSIIISIAYSIACQSSACDTHTVWVPAALRHIQFLAYSLGK